MPNDLPHGGLSHDGQSGLGRTTWVFSGVKAQVYPPVRLTTSTLSTRLA